MAEQKQKNAPQMVQHEVFMIVKLDKTYKIAMGQQLIVPHKFKTLKDAKAYIDSKPWELMINSASYLTQFMINNQEKLQEEMKNEQKKQN